MYDFRRTVHGKFSKLKFQNQNTLEQNKMTSCMSHMFLIQWIACVEQVHQITSYDLGTWEEGRALYFYNLLILTPGEQTYDLEIRTSNS